MNLSLSPTDYAALSPYFVLLIGSLIVLLLEAFSEVNSRRYAFYITIITLLATIYAALAAPVSTNALLTPWIKFDVYNRFFIVLFSVIGIGTSFLAASFFEKFIEPTRGEYYFLLLTAVFGLILIGASADFLTLFLGIETLSISLYILCGYMKSWELSHESAIKYFLMGALAAAFLLYGIALIYGAIGSTQFSALLPGFKALSTVSSKAMFLSGIALVTLVFAFEAALVPFHVWAPDVYDGAPTPVTAFMSVGTKAGAIVAFIRVFMEALPQFDLAWNEGVSFLIYPTLIYANYVALKQTHLRRFFAYSGISHAGFMLIPVVAGTAEAIPSLFFYLVVYVIATLGCFAVLAFVDKRKEGVSLDNLAGLFNHSPILAAIMSLCLLTLAGIPPTAGFFAKFYIFKVAFQAGYYALVIVGLLTTVLSAYYYLRIIGVMLSGESCDEIKPLPTLPAAVVGAAAFAAIVVLSIYPAPLLNLVNVFK
jgi:NADH-quinone oxidoreductase subunit N